MAQSLLSREQIEAMVVRQAQAWEKQDVKAIADDFAEDAVFIAAGFKFLGKQKIEQAARDYFEQFHQTTVEIKNIIIEGDKGAVEWEWRDHRRNNGQEGFAEDAIVFKLREGKIIYWREYIEKKKP
ncbi:MAG: nuclear transport factor 2 family protein [Cyanobacteria bacterium J06621_12]